MFAGLVANTFNNGEVVDESSVESILPQDEASSSPGWA